MFLDVDEKVEYRFGFCTDTKISAKMHSGDSKGFRSGISKYLRLKNLMRESEFRLFFT
jgi:hypothetical protein